MLMQTTIFKVKPRPSAGTPSPTVGTSPRQQQQQGNAGLPGAQTSQNEATAAKAGVDAQRGRMELGQVPAAGMVKAELDLKTAQAINEQWKSGPLEVDYKMSRITNFALDRGQHQVMAEAAFLKMERQVEHLRSNGDVKMADALQKMIISARKPLDEYAAESNDYVQATMKTLMSTMGAAGKELGNISDLNINPNASSGTVRTINQEP